LALDNTKSKRYRDFGEKQKIFAFLPLKQTVQHRCSSVKGMQREKRARAASLGVGAVHSAAICTVQRNGNENENGNENGMMKASPKEAYTWKWKWKW
jgi:hypothetical protein